MSTISRDLILSGKTKTVGMPTKSQRGWGGGLMGVGWNNIYIPVGVQVYLSPTIIKGQVDD
jgi:hypothetical protein